MAENYAFMSFMSNAFPISILLISYQQKLNMKQGLVMHPKVKVQNIVGSKHVTPK
jgi:hypothetical protein